MRKILLSLALIAGLAAPASAADNYAATAGSGLTFAAKDNGSSVLFPRHIGCDNTTTTQCWTINASGQLAIAAASGAFASGSLAAGSMVDLLTVRQTVAAGTAASNSLLTGGVYNSTPITLTNGQGSALQLSANGYLNTVVTNTNPNGQAVMNSSSPVVVASNQSAIPLWGHGATGAAVPANATYIGFNSGGNLTGPSTSAPLPVRPGDGTRNAIVDPCEANLQTYTTGVITSATTTRIIAPSASNKNYLCSFFLTASATDNVAVVEGTGGTCGSGTAGVIGGTTTANGLNFVANGGVMMQAGGKVAVAQTAGTNVDTCLITSSTGPLVYAVKYVQAP